MSDLYKITTRADGRLTYALVTPRATASDIVRYALAAVGIAAGLYVVAIAFIWHL